MRKIEDYKSSEVIDEVLTQRVLKWENLSCVMQKALSKYGVNVEMVNFIMDNWRVYKSSDVVHFNSFDSNNMALSNMFPFVCSIKGKVFNSVDHILHWARARKVGDEELIKEMEVIHGVQSAFSAKCAWQRYCEKHSIPSEKTSVQGLKDSIDCLRYAWKVKYECCREFRDKLAETMGKKLMENAFWGDAIYGAEWNGDKRVFEGLNLCGRYMTKFRDSIINANPKRH